MTTATTHRELVQRLAAKGKSNRGAAGYSRWVNRRLGRHLAAVSYRVGLTPNQVSLISGVFTFPALAAVALVRVGWLVDTLVVVALLLGYAFDSADGQLARLRGGGSYAGEWLDHVLDALKMSSVHLVIAIAWFRFYDLVHPADLLVPLGFCVVSVVFFFALLLADLLRRIELARSGAPPSAAPNLDSNAPAPVLRSLVVLPNDYGLLALSLLLLPAPTAFRIVYSLLFAANLLFLLTGSVRWFREMARLGS